MSGGALSCLTHHLIVNGCSLVSDATLCSIMFNSLGVLKNHLRCNHTINLNYSQRQVLTIQIALYVNFALKLSGMIRE